MCDQEIKVQLPSFFDNVVGCSSYPIFVDACIADVLQLLWEKRIVTTYSCCGHWKEKPRVAIGPHEDAKKVHALLQEGDTREWAVYQSFTCEVTAEGEIKPPQQAKGNHENDARRT